MWVKTSKTWKGWWVICGSWKMECLNEGSAMNENGDS
jgi:hypothetical protein